MTIIVMLAIIGITVNTFNISEINRKKEKVLDTYSYHENEADKKINELNTTWKDVINPGIDNDILVVE